MENKENVGLYSTASYDETGIKNFLCILEAALSTKAIALAH